MDGYSVEALLARVSSTSGLSGYLAWIGVMFVISAAVAGYLPDNDLLGVYSTRVCYGAIGLFLLSALIV